MGQKAKQKMVASTGAGWIDDFAPVGGGVFVLPLKDLLYGATETAMEFDGDLPLNP